MTHSRNRKPRQMTGALSRSRTSSPESSYRIRPIASPHRDINYTLWLVLSKSMTPNFTLRHYRLPAFCFRKAEASSTSKNNPMR